MTTTITFIYNLANGSYSNGPVKIDGFGGQVGCTEFKSIFHQMRPVIVAVAHRYDTVYAWDYTIKSSWEPCKFVSQ